MTDNHKDSTSAHGNIGKLVQIGKVDGGVTIQDTLESYTCCPVCNRNDEVKKVSAILARETHSMNGVTIEKRLYQDSNGNWQTSTESVPFSGTQSTVLAMKLNPPTQPQAKGKPSRIWWLRFLILMYALPALVMGILEFVGIPLGLLLGLPNSGHMGEAVLLMVAALAQILVGIGLMFWFLSVNNKYKKKNDAYNQEINRVQKQEFPKWQKAVERWKKLYYCFRNDCVFIPDEMTYAEADSINEYVYRVT